MQKKRNKQRPFSFPISISPLILTLCTQAAEYLNCKWNIVYHHSPSLCPPPLLPSCFPQNGLTHNDRTAVYSHKWHLMHSALIMCAVACCISIPLLSTSPSQEVIMVIRHLREGRRKEGRSCQRERWRERERWEEEVDVCTDRRRVNGYILVIMVCKVMWLIRCALQADEISLFKGKGWKWLWTWYLLWVWNPSCTVCCCFFWVSVGHNNLGIHSPWFGQGCSTQVSSLLSCLEMFFLLSQTCLGLVCIWTVSVLARRRQKTCREDQPGLWVRPASLAALIAGWRCCPAVSQLSAPHRHTHSLQYYYKNRLHCHLQEQVMFIFHSVLLPCNNQASSFEMCCFMHQCVRSNTLIVGL